jgi:pyruvate dehydrogenase E2 component (dihydrolipoamide acetyltransferase)
MAQIVSMPKLGFDMAEGTLVRWIVLEGETVAKGSVLAEIETDKATVEVESNYDGTVLRHLVEAGTIVPVNTPIAVIGAPGEQVELAGISPAIVKDKKEKAEAVASKAAAPVSKAESAAGGMTEEGNLPGGVRASPLARRLAEEKGLDIHLVPGSGPQGRVTKEDIETYIGKVKEIQPHKPSLPVAQVEESEGDRVVNLSKLRAIIGRRMVESTRSAPHFYVTHEFDMSALAALRLQLNLLLADDDKTSVNDFVLRAVALALKKFPNLNASLDEQKSTVIQHARINVGIAVAVENGLLTMVCQDTDQKTIRQISQEVRGMVSRARAGKVRTEEIEGSTFTVSNLGMFDVEQFTAIINPPEAAILAVGSVKEVPVVVNGSLQPGLRMKATLSVDHRVSDGAEAAKFLQALAEYLEEPVRLLI